jgi:hypothetical protein
VRACLAIFVLSVAVRLAYVLLRPADYGPPFGELERAAASLAERGALADVFGEGSGPTAHVAPFYAYVLAGVYRIFGLPQHSGRLPQQILAIAVSSLRLALLPLVGRRCGLSWRAGVVAGFLLALSPLNLGNESLGRWEANWSALAVVGLVWVFACLHNRRWRSWTLAVLAGALVGLSALASPVVLPAAALMLASEVVLHRGERARVAAGAAVVLLAAGLVVAPWVWRNLTVLGGFVPLRSNFGLELHLGNHEGADGRTGHHTEVPDRSAPVHHPYDNPAEIEHLKKIGEVAYMRGHQHEAAEWIRDHPDEFLTLTASRLRMYWFPPADLWAPGDRGRLLRAGTYALAGAGAVVGLAVLFWWRNPYRWLLLAALAGPCVAHAITHVDVRYRYPTLPLSVLVGCAAFGRGRAAA